MFIAAVLSSVTIASLAASRCRELCIGALARLLLVPLLGFVAFNTVLSPQFMIWLLPLAALGTLAGNPLIILGVPFATVLTPIIFPSFGSDYGLGLNGFETTVLIMRNCVLVTVWCLLMKEHWRIWRNGDSKRTKSRVGARLSPSFPCWTVKKCLEYSAVDVSFRRIEYELETGIHFN